MTFLWPQSLWLLLLLPLLVIVYWLLLRRRKKQALRYAGLAVVKDAMGSGQRVRRHIPPLLFLMALALMLLAGARPAAIVMLPSQHKTIVLAVDVSYSMRANDVEPNRLAAAQAAVRRFIEKQPRNTRVGLIAFAGSASVLLPPTSNKEDAMAAVDRLQLQPGTAIGSGILVSLNTIFPDLEYDLNASDPHVKPTPESESAPLGSEPPRENHNVFKPVPPGSFNSAAIILLSDGQTTTGPDPVLSSSMAAERGVRVYTVGVGTDEGEVLHGDGWAMRARLDEEALKKIADVTKGQYFYAGTANDLSKVYSTLNSQLTLEKGEYEISSLFAVAAAVLAVLAAFLSMLWFNRVL